MGRRKIIVKEEVEVKDENIIEGVEVSENKEEEVEVVVAQASETFDDYTIPDAINKSAVNPNGVKVERPLKLKVVGENTFINVLLEDGTTFDILAVSNK